MLYMYEKLIVFIQPRTIAQLFTFLSFTFKSTTHHRAAFYFFIFYL